MDSNMDVNEDALSAVLQAESTVKIPSPHDRVINHECLFSFDTPYNPSGIYTSLTTWQSFGEEYVEKDFQRNSNPLYVKQVWKRVLVAKKKDGEEEKADAEKDNSKDAPSKMAIGVDGGFNVDEKKYEKFVTNSLVVFPERHEIPLPNAKLSPNLVIAIDTVLAHDGFERSAAVEQAAWEEEDRKESKYAKDLIQLDTNGKTISPDPSKWICEESGMRENLWLNLSTGHIGSGRRNWDGTGGTGAAKNHFEQTGKKYPLVVKLGTITPKGADVFSYADDEGDMVIDPYLDKHLAHWGINMLQQEKTEKTITELQIELNANYNFSKITESGSNLQPLHGKGYIGLINLGNSCYMSSVLQMIMSIPEIENKFKMYSNQIFDTAPKDPSQDVLSMMAKLALGLTTDKYSKPELIYEYKSDGDTSEVMESSEVMTDDEYGNVKPMMFKGIIGKGHAEFSSGRQQDAAEFFQYFLEKMNRAERAGKRRLLLSSENNNSSEYVPVSALFGFELEDRIEDGQTNKVKYVTRDDNLLSLNIDVNDAVNKKQYDDFKHEQQMKKKAKYDEEIEEVAVTLNVPLESCLKNFASPEMVEHFQSPETGKTGHALKKTRFKTFPEYLAVHLKRYYLDKSWMPKKLDAQVHMPLELSLEHLRSTGLRKGEVLMKDDSMNIDTNGGNNQATTSTPSSNAVVPDANIVKQLIDMGFSENGSKRAAIATNNSSAQESMEWVFQHMSDANFNDPVEVEQPQPAANNDTGSNSNATDPSSDPKISPEAIANLTVMGFTNDQAKAALIAVDGSLERAADWLFSHADSLDAAVKEVFDEAEQKVEEEQAMSSTANSVKRLDGEGNYEMVGFASHLGSNTSCGHYVAHIRKEGRFVLFNDEKVAVSKKPPTDLGFLYIYKRKQ